MVLVVSEENHAGYHSMNAEALGNVQVTWPDGESINLPTLWLRDVCPCENCRIAQTQEERFHLATLDSVSIETLTVGDDQLCVTGPVVMRVSIQGPSCRESRACNATMGTLER